MDYCVAESIAPNVTEVQQMITDVLVSRSPCPSGMSDRYLFDTKYLLDLRVIQVVIILCLCIWTYYLDQEGAGMLGPVNSKKCKSIEDLVNHTFIP